MSLLFLVGNNTIFSFLNTVNQKQSFVLKNTKEANSNTDDTDDECDCEKETNEEKVKDIHYFSFTNDIHFFCHKEEKYFLSDVIIHDSKFTSIVIPPPNI